MPRIFWFLLSAMLAAWLGMNIWTAPRIEALSGGLRLPEMRLTGYSFEDARAFLAAIGDEGRAFYLGVQLRLDTLFPPLLAAVLFLCFRGLYPGLSGLIIGTASLSSVIVDYLENAALAAMLRAGPEALTPEMVATANQWTTAKWGLALVGLATLIVGIGLRIGRRWFERREGL
ncbi:hypothetical protein AXZ77_3736 [Thioclava sp. ES.031]|uniref:hypothetical protein n=1 Tax=Thioclava sp. ES.031 TaxID=1798203 RepID=UPI000BF63CF8|nr:hypothetical protein [Thioclava sp. ES.031]PFG65087.1 hypothetical protein AXZ77_3736 [Thioclava sp. ES.031]